MRNRFFVVAVVLIIGEVMLLIHWPGLMWTLILIVPALLLGFFDAFQSRHTIRRNFPLVGRGRWIMEEIRPFIRQYLIESDTDGTPINRMFRNIVYQRAKGDRETIPYGTQVDTYRLGYEWIGHSMAAIDGSTMDSDLRIQVGGPECQQPYSASIFNISAMSFGALSSRAIRALNLGTQQGGFAHNTGEGGISPAHLQHGGDLIWQIGTAYFGCRDNKGGFSPEAFREKSQLAVVKMIEIKLSQGAKPGHGGILPADKNSPEIAAIRGVEPHTQVDSPPTHSSFSTPLEMMSFIAQLRELSGGKPIGFKLSIGRRSEFVALCKAMLESGIKPDFITVDGGEGGTGAAPLEYTNSVGMPLRDAIAFVDDILTGFGLRKDIRIIASGKILTGFHLVKNIALGADMCNSARGMMMALGCVHSLICNSNRCPTGIATQDPALEAGLVVEDKAQRVARFHEETVKATADLIASAGLSHTDNLNRTHIFRRISQTAIRRYDEIFHYMREGVLCGDDYPESFRLDMLESSPHTFAPSECMTCINHQIIEVNHP